MGLVIFYLSGTNLSEALVVGIESSYGTFGQRTEHLHRRMGVHASWVGFFSEMITETGDCGKICDIEKSNLRNPR